MREIVLLPFHDRLVEIHRRFHRIPELSYQEELTSAAVQEILSEWGVPFRAGIAKTGVKAWLDSGRPGPTVAIRADMDALPVEEEADVSYRSEHPGVMHACGHDAHMTVALGVIRFLLDGEWFRTGRGRVLFFFQPAEEGNAGAEAMIRDGVLDEEQIDAVCAVHVHPALPVGELGIVPDVCYAACDVFDIVIRGKGGHGAHPELCRDPLMAGAHLLTLLPGIVGSRTAALESVVLTVGSFHAGIARNVIPDEAVMEGTLRTLNDAAREAVFVRLSEIAEGIGTAFGVTVRVDRLGGSQALRNHPDVANAAVRVARRLFGDGSVHIQGPDMVSEDFASFTQRIPGALIRLGCRRPDEPFVHGLHSPRFDLDERVLDVGVSLMGNLVLEITQKGLAGTVEPGMRKP